MKICVLSDTHGEVSVLRRAICLFNGLNVGLTIHCGDIGVEVVPLLGGMTTHFVYGNMDDPNCLREVITDPEHTLHEGLGTLEIEGRRIAFLHGNDVKLLHHTIHSGHWDLVCHGHTHVFSSSIEGNTLVVNPGAIGRTNHPSLAVVDLPTLSVTEIPL